MPDTPERREFWMRPPTTSLSTALMIAISQTMVIVVVLVDWFTGPDFSPVLLYVIPLIFAVWIGGARAGALTGAFVIIGEVAVLEIGTPRPPQADIVWLTVERVIIYGALVWLIAGQQRLFQEQERLATTDALTGALNRRALFEVVTRELERARRYDHPVACLYLDLDRLKEVNDEQGHRAGDAMLERFAAIVRSTLRSSDLFARVGGDEFAVFLPETNAGDARTAGERILDALRDAAAGGNGTPLEASIGVAAYDKAPELVEPIMLAADHAMYDAKRAGGNRIVFVHPAARDNPDLVRGGADDASPIR